MTGIPARLAAASGAFYVVVIIVGGEIMNGDGLLARVGYALVVLSFAGFVVFLAFLQRMVEVYRDDLTPELARTRVDLNGIAFVTTGRTS